ncbi:MAG: aldehyde dehydrogenase family protein [Bilophila wadsworthia]
MLEDPSREAITELMKVPISSSPPAAAMWAAYPAATRLRCWAGNACAIVAEDADVAEAAKMICGSKLFDYATSCSSENAVIPVEAVYDQFMAEMKKNGCYLVTGEDREKLKNHMWKPNAKGKIALNPDIIAKSAQVIADGAGISIPEGTDILLVEGMEPILGDKFHDEKISPVLTVYKAKDFKDAYRILVELTNLVGRGHSCGIHTYKHEYIEFLGEHMKSSRITVRQSMSAGNGGHPFNRMPSTATLGCGTWGGNSTTENVHWRHFINVTWVNEPVAPWTFTDEDMWGDFWKKYGK